MQLDEGVVYPMIKPNELNPSIDFTTLPFELNTSLTVLNQKRASSTDPLRALINSYGLGGSYSCLVLSGQPTPHASSTNIHSTDMRPENSTFIQKEAESYATKHHQDVTQNKQVSTEEAADAIVV